MADYSDLMKLEKKPKPPTSSFATDTAQPVILLANQQTSKEGKKQTSLPTNQLASKPANQQTSKQFKKFGSYLREESIKALKHLALQIDRKEYEVLQDAVDFYLKHKDNS